MESGRRATGVVALVAMMVVLQLMAAPTAMARSLQDTTPVLSLNRIARELSSQGDIQCGQTCFWIPCLDLGRKLMETHGRANNNRHEARHHFVLVHGLCHGAWCWYKAATALRRAGHRATAPDMAGCGAHPARAGEVRGFEEYSRPLLDAVATLPPGERAVLVGHSHGGCSVALAAERFPDKVAAAVFVTASMPAVGRSMGAATTDEYLKFVAAEPDFFLDTEEQDQENPEIPGRPVLFGPKFVAQRLYQLCPAEDLTLALSLIRPANRFDEDALMKDEKLLTEAGYGSTRRVFVVVEGDLGIPAEFQRRMIALSPGVEVEAMAAGGADHMAMLSGTEELVELLIRVANKCTVRV